MIQGEEEHNIKITFICTEQSRRVEGKPSLIKKKCVIFQRGFHTLLVLLLNDGKMQRIFLANHLWSGTLGGTAERS